MTDDGAKSQQKMFYSMGEVAEMFDVNPSLLRFWERKFDIIKPRKTQKGNRQFSRDDIRGIKLIYHLVKERGMTLDGAAKQIKAGRKSIERDMELTERLQSIRSLLLEVRGRLGAGGGEVVITDDPSETFAAPPAAETQNAPQNEGGPLEPIIEQAHEEEVIDVLMEDVIEELHREPEEMPDFDPLPGEPEDEPEEEEKEPEKPKPLFIDQTLF